MEKKAKKIKYTELSDAIELKAILYQEEILSQDENSEQTYLKRREIAMKGISKMRNKGYRDILKLKLKNFSDEKIAQLLEIPYKKFREKKYRAKESLKRTLGKMGYSTKDY